MPDPRAAESAPAGDCHPLCAWLGTRYVHSSLCEHAPPDEGYTDRVKRLHVEHLRTCEECNDAAGLFCDIARSRAYVLNGLGHG